MQLGFIFDGQWLIVKKGHMMQYRKHDVLHFNSKQYPWLIGNWHKERQRSGPLGPTPRRCAWEEKISFLASHW